MDNALQVVNGRLSEIENLCLTHAIRTFKERREADTNPQIVQMVHDGDVLGHWYYRSDEWIDQPYFIKSRLIQLYTGPAELAMPLLYGEGTYVPDEGLMKFISREDVLVKFTD